LHIWNIALSVVKAEEEAGAEESTFLGTPFHRPGLAPEELFSIGPVHVTNSMFTTLLVVLFVSLLAIWLTRRMQLIPNGRQNFLEVIVEGLLGLIESAAGHRVGRIILPLIGTLFVYIVAANWFALLPGVGTILYHGEHDVPLLRAPNSDYNMTFAMALLTIVIVQVAGFAAHGFGGHLKEYRNPFNIIDEFARLLSLSVRLFANVFAGEVLVGVMLALSFLALEYFLFFAFAVPAMFLALEVFFGAIQALVFALLSLIYISLAVGGHGEGHDVEHDASVAHADDQAAPLTQESAARS
jgi:F-type H+-transporting ATPase subunit a